MTDLQCRAVGFVYGGEVRALDAVDVSLAAGERVAIVGQNGSGKTTLVRHFNGLLRPTEGSVLVGGRDTRTLRTAQLAPLVGLAFQDPDRQIFAASVRREAAFGARNVGLRGPELDAAIDAALGAVGLAGEEDTNPYDLGYARRKLLTIASVLAMGTPVVILDEPTTGQDAHGARRMQQIVSQLAADGRTVIAVSHDLRFVAESFERVIVMRAGSIVLDGPPTYVFEESRWPTLGSTNLAPPYAARAGAALGLGATPTDALVVEALAAGRSSDRHAARDADQRA